MTKFRDWFNRRRQGLSGGSSSQKDSLVLELVPWVAETIPESELFEERAHTAAERLGPNSLRALSKYIYHYFPETEVAEERDERNEYEPFGIWPDVCQRALFEIIYHLGTKSIPFLRLIAFGERDRSQSYAVNMLCRFGQSGIEREKIAAQLITHLRKWDWDDTPIVNSLTSICELALVAPALMIYLDQTNDTPDGASPEVSERLWQSALPPGLR